MSNYGTELILDLHECDPSTYATRNQLEVFIAALCKKIDMEAEDIHFWDYDGEPEEYEKAPAHLKGRSVVQFIRTSTIVIHTLDEMLSVYLKRINNTML